MTSFFGLHACIIKAYILNNNNYKKTQVILLSDAHSVSTKETNIQQMNSFLNYINTLSSTKSDHIHIIAESLFFHGIDLKKTTEIEALKQFYNTFKIIPEIEKNALLYLNAKKVNPYDLNPNKDASTWMSWDLPFSFIKQSLTVKKKVTVTAFDPRQMIYLFGQALCSCENNQQGVIPSNLTLKDIYNYIQLLLQEYVELTKTWSQTAEDKIMILNKQAQLKELLNIFGSPENMASISPGTCMSSTLFANPKAILLRLFALIQKNNNLLCSYNLMAQDSFLGSNLLEIAIINNILFDHLKNNQPQTIFVLAGNKHIQQLKQQLCQDLDFSVIGEYPSDIELMNGYDDFIHFFDDIFFKYLK